MTAILFSPSIGPIPVSVLISERHVSDLEITGNPIENGAEVNDHAYIKPKEIRLEIADANAAQTFNDFLRVQASRDPFDLVTGLTVYRNMLIAGIDATPTTETVAADTADVAAEPAELGAVGTTPVEDETKSQSILYQTFGG